MFVVYHIKSTMDKKYFKRMGDAKRATEKMNAAQSDHDRKWIGGYGYTTVENYKANVVYMVTRKNLLTGKEYQEPSNTPGFMSPSSEAYHSM